MEVQPYPGGNQEITGTSHLVRKQTNLKQYNTDLAFVTEN